MVSISLDKFEFDKKHKSLRIASEYFAGSFPDKVCIKSHHTGKALEFVPLTIGDEGYDLDCWDGEMMVYKPVTVIPKVKEMIIYHAW